MAGAAGAVAASAGWLDSAPLRDYWTALAAVLALCLLAYLTNPTPASFSTHVTSLCFHAHIRRCDQLPLQPDSHRKQASTTRPGGTALANGTSTTTAHANGKDSSIQPAAAATHGRRKGQAAVAVDPRAAAKRTVPDRHVLSFSNRISLSIKTHTYSYSSYHLFSTVFVPSARPPPASAGLRKQQRRHPELSALLGLGGELWLGLFGNWYALRWWAGPEGEDGERKGRLETGVREMSIEDDERDSDFPTSSAIASTAASVSGSSTPASHPLSHNPSSSIDHRVSLPLSSTADPTSPPSPTKTSPAGARLSKRVFRAGQRRSSPTSLTRLKTKAEHAAREAAEAERAATDDAASTTKGAAGSPLGAGLGDAAGNGLCGAVSTDPIVVELQAQLDELRASAVESEKRLQDELEVLRGKKRDEDAFRAELKAKTKQLEEAKRAAEASRVEAEKELSERKGVVKEAQGRVDKLRDEIRALERKGLEAIERKEKKKRERKEREKKLRDDVAKKRDELREKEEGLADVMRKVGEMERKLEVRRALLAGRRAELAQYAVSGMRGGVPPGGAAMYGMAPPHLLPATATLGGVGAMANAFAAPFGQGGYGRRNYPYVHPLSANNSRPTSIRSGHFDPHTGAFQSAPSSPTMSHPVSPHDDPSPYGAGNHSHGVADPTGGWPTSFPSAANGGSHALPQSGAAGTGHAAGFLEHRLQHRAAHGDEVLPAHFVPFDFVGLGPAAAADGDNEPSPQHRTTRAGSLSNDVDDHSPGGTALGKPRTLALPMQYLDSGLLAGTDSPGLMDGPLSPMTPHQTSLIPSQLFHLLDDDEDDDGLFVVPDSPTLRAGVGMGLKGAADWQGLGLDAGALGGGRRASEEVKREESAATGEAPAGDDNEAPVERQRSPPVLSPRVEAFVNAEMASTTTTSPIGPPPSSPFSPWAADPIGPPSATPSPAMTPASIGFDLSSLKGMSAAPGSGGASHAFHRVSPSQDLDDDLPRAGLSLNPGAKAFAFPFAHSHSHTRTSSVPSPPASIAAAVRATRSGTMSSFDGRSTSTSTTVPSPVAAAPAPVGSGLALSPPAKSRMEFARASDAAAQTSSSVSAAGVAAPLSARLSPGFDWPSVAASGSPVFAAPLAPGAGAALAGADKVPTPTSTAAAAPGSASGSAALFNPFDDEDELLGPLRK